jgi:hypothetical protein
MALFDVDNPDAHIGYRNLRAAEFPVEKEIKATSALEGTTDVPRKREYF